MNEEIITDLEKALERRGITPPKPKPRPTPAAAKGLELAAIHKVVDASVKDIDDCFSEWHNRRSTDEVVEVTMRFDIDAKGAVRRTRMSGLDDVFLRECIDGNFKHMAFPPSDGITDVKYVFESRANRQLGVSSQIVGARLEAEPSRPPAPAPSPIDFGKTDFGKADFGKTYSP